MKIFTIISGHIRVKLNVNKFRQVVIIFYFSPVKMTCKQRGLQTNFEVLSDESRVLNPSIPKLSEVANRFSFTIFMRSK